MNELGRTILKSEARIGAKVFKEDVPGKREFYCLDANTWVWRHGSVTVFYKINPASIYKSNDGASYRLVTKEEASRLFKAAKIYKSLVENKIYGSLLALG